MEIGLFQLENLFVSHARFCFLDLRSSPPAEVHPGLDKILTSAEKVADRKLEDHLTTQNVDKNTPVVLLCENGRVSSAAAGRLEKKGFCNIYVIEGGIQGLLSEL